MKVQATPAVGLFAYALTLFKARMFDDESELLPKLRGTEVMEALTEVTSPEAEEAAIAEALAAVETGSDKEKEDATKVTDLETLGGLPALF